MPRNAVTILDAEGNVVATADVELREGVYSGSAHLGRMPETMRRLFEEFEGIVNDQTFGLLDRIEGQIHAIPLLVVFEDGRVSEVTDLQIFPKGGTVSFKAGGSVMLRPKAVGGAHPLGLT